MASFYKSLVLSIFFVLGTQVAQAQSTAVMKVSVTVVNGSSVESSAKLNFNPLITEAEDYASDLTITNAPYAQVLIQHNKFITATNQFGENIRVDTEGDIESDLQKGTYKFLIKPKVASTTPLKGTYQGTLSTTIEYL